ncbi:MFS transporter [Intrasporangium sp. YIM S08009]|uniref:MFS transporter n=1 Tax=Intrasporangium zincisolvens TaxID=3080018 RepID=UPI002B0608FE|nr:MFS transporter [Intrasporangium sp. YIM S08009]
MGPRRAIAVVLASNAVEYLAFRFTQVALPVVVVQQLGSASTAGLVAGASGVPVLLSPWWARRLRQRVGDGRGLAVVALGQAGALAVVPIAVWLGLLHPVLLVAVGLVVGAGDALAAPGRTALLGDLGDKLGEATATRAVTWDDASRRATMVAGPALAGLGVHAGLVDAMLWVEAAGLVVSAVVVRRVVLDHPADAPSRPVDLAHVAPGTGRAPGILESVRDHPDVVRGWVMRGTSCLLWFAFVLGLAVAGERSGEPGVLYAWGLSAYGIGSLVTTVVLAHRPLSGRPLRLATLAWVGQGAAFAVMGLVQTPLGVAVTAAAAGLVTVVGIRAITQVILTQTSGPGRRSALAGQAVVVNAASALGLLVGGVVIDQAGVGPTLVAAGFVTALAAVVAGSFRVRASDTSTHTGGAGFGRRGDLTGGRFGA